MAIEQAIQPCQVRAVVLEQPVTHAVGVVVSAGAGVDVVVELEEADSELVDEPVHHAIEVLDCRRVAKVEVIAVVLDDALAVPKEEGLARQGVGDGTADADDFGFEPQPGNHAGIPDGVDDLAETAGEPGRDGIHSPTVSHQCPLSSYHPASMQKISAPTSAAAATSGRSRSVVGSPLSVFM